MVNELLIIATVIIDLFPIYIISKASNSYDGSGYELAIILGLIEWFWIEGVLLDEIKRYDVLEDYNDFLASGFTKELMELKIAKQEEDKIKYKRQKYGDSYKEISFLDGNIILSEKLSIIVIGNIEYRFKDILEASIYDQSIMVQSTITSTDMKSAIGRAIIGGAIAGVPGSIIGSNTAKKTSVTDKSASGVNHDYSIYVTINNLSTPTIKIHIGHNEMKLNEIYSILKIIIKRNQEAPQFN